MLHHGQTCKPPLEGREIRNQCGHRPFPFFGFQPPSCCAHAAGQSRQRRPSLQVRFRKRRPERFITTCHTSAHEATFSPNETLWNIGSGLPRQSALMPANFTTLAHFSVSSAISFTKSAGEPTSGVPPKSASRALIVGSARPALISLLSLSTMSAGVFLGAPMPVHKVASKPGTKSLTVETCGSASERVAVVTASARSLPVLTYSIDEDMLGNMTCTCPASRSGSAGPPPR